MDIKEIKLIEENLTKMNFKITIKENKNILVYDNIEKELTNKEIEKFIDKFLRITNSWNKTYYINSNELDKTNWTLEITLLNNKVIKYVGNTFPSNYSSLTKLIGEVINNELA